VERPWKIRGYHLSPYVSAEFWYTSQYQKWSTTSVFAGCIFPLGRHVGFNPYYEHENNTGKSPNQQLNQLGLMLNVAMKGRLLISDRNRADLDWMSSTFSWHYRNRITIERPATIRRYHLSPYGSAEFWYTSQYAKWSTTSIFAGCMFPIGKHVDFNP